MSIFTRRLPPWLLPLTRRTFTYTLKSLATIHLIQTTLFQIAPTSGPSMLPTFSLDGDWVLADMTSARNRRGNISVGDLVLYKIPIDEYSVGVKRVVGMPGDYVLANTPGQEGEEKMILVSFFDGDVVEVRC